MFKKENGITLVALVVTIIVLLILAGVSISMISGDDGIATQASKAKSETDIGNVEDAINMAVSAAKTAHYAKFADGSVTTLKPALTVKDVNDSLSGYTIDGTETSIIGSSNDTKTFDVKKSGDSTAAYTVTFTVETETEGSNTYYNITDAKVSAK